MSHRVPLKDLIADTERRRAKVPAITQKQSLFCSVVAFGFVCALLMFFSLVVQSAWNYIIPKLFGLPSLSYLEANALLVLVQIIKWTPKDGPTKAARVITEEDKIDE